MSASDKISAGMENLKGKAKETFGKITNDEDTEAEGKADQARAKLKDAATETKDAAKHAGERVKGAAEDVLDD